jgi:hypothetical protein
MTARATMVQALFFVTVTSIAAGSASAQLATWHTCGLAPAANEVFIYRDPNLKGPCAGLYAGFYPYTANGLGGFGIGNDNISSAWLGSGVRARVYDSIIYTGPVLGPFTDLAAGATYLSMPTGWENRVSSIRVTDASRSASCDDLRAGEFGLYNVANFAPRGPRGQPLDCVVLRYEIGGVAQAYPRPEEMGFPNDSLLAMRAGPPDPNVPPGYVISTFIYQDSNFTNRAMLATSAGGSDIPNLSLSPWLFNGRVSSIKVFYQAIVP